MLWTESLTKQLRVAKGLAGDSTPQHLLSEDGYWPVSELMSIYIKTDYVTNKYSLTIKDAVLQTSIQMCDSYSFFLVFN